MVKEPSHNAPGKIRIKKPSFFMKARLQSIVYALQGIRKFFVQEPNAIIHLTATIAVIAMIFCFDFSKTEIAILGLSIGFVWAAEIFNTAIEEIMDFIFPEYHPKVKLIKDMSAGAVLLAAVNSVITAIIILGPKFF